MTGPQLGSIGNLPIPYASRYTVISGRQIGLGWQTPSGSQPSFKSLGFFVLANVWTDEPVLLSFNLFNPQQSLELAVDMNGVKRTRRFRQGDSDRSVQFVLEKAVRVHRNFLRFEALDGGFCTVSDVVIWYQVRP